MKWRRFDTLFLRLFVLMWVTLVLSHLFAFLAVSPLFGPSAGGPGARPARAGTQPPPNEPGFSPGRPGAMGLPTLPSLPPGNPIAAESPAPGGAPHLPRAVLWTDYALRMLVIALGAALGARWLAAPMQRLAAAAGSLSDRLARGEPVPALSETLGTQEVRQGAAVFNQMAQRLQRQFDARGMQMAALSHDLRTPLTRLRMRIEQLPPQTATAAAQDIHEMDEMIAGTLAVLREQQQGAAAPVVELSALLQALCDDLAEQGHEVRLESPAPLRARAHPAALRRVLDNLVSNALRYGKDVSISLGPAGAAQVELRVEDCGPGIPPEQLDQAFQPWVRLAGEWGRKSHGHGLGLAIARDLAERDGGALSLHNRPEGGLSARLVLPMA